MNNITFIPIKLDEPIAPDQYSDDDFLEILLKKHQIQDGDILAITSKVISIIEGRVLHQDSHQVSEKYVKLASLYDKPPLLLKSIIDEGGFLKVIPMKKILNDRKTRDIFFSSIKSKKDEDEIINRHSYVFMSKVFGLNADSSGIDRTNLPPGHFALLPKSPKDTANRLMKLIKKKYHIDVGIVITDTLGGDLSTKGHWDMPIGYAGINPIEEKVGHPDLYHTIDSGGRANQLIPISTMAGLIMGSCSECTPAVIIKNLANPLLSGIQNQYSGNYDDNSISNKAIVKFSLWSIFSTIIFYLRIFSYGIVYDSKKCLLLFYPYFRLKLEHRR